MLVPLRELIGRAADRFAWYETWSGATSDRVSELGQLPLLTASVLEAHYYADDNPLAHADGYRVYRTSGTSAGRRKAIFYSPRDEEEYMRIKLDVFREILGRYGYRTAMSDVGTGHAEATASAVFRQLGMTVESLSFQLPIAHHLERLATFKPEVLYTMPSILDRIMLASDDPAAYGIRHIVLVGEMASPGWIARVAERMRIDAKRITDTYGSIEIGTIAHYSHEHGRYVFADGILAEGVGTEALGAGFEPLSEPSESVLVLTSAVRDAFPALRYVTYDVVRDLRPIEIDGAERMSFASLVRRIGPDLKHGEKISIYDIEGVVFRHLAEASIRVHVRDNALSVTVYGKGAESETLARIRDDLADRIPDIGGMIRAGILGGIEVTGEAYDDDIHRGAVKNKKIYYT
ncbi:CoF synthetase [Cohnella sp. GCM10027633]|uniref:CoF synthetase n=1 Tax=unclassified Cohnella TaxID=2636738 RepID=UPI00363FC007